MRCRKKQPRWKKRYLQAGLFSDYFKEDEPRKASNADAGANKNKMLYDPTEHPHGLLPPPYHCGKFLRQREIPFQLPYDLWWLHTHSRLPGRDLVPSWNYR
jgi:histone-lysine N-methyltransferase ASH1L